MGDDELRKRWPRVADVRGTSVVVEAGDILILPQGVWHQVHSLDAHNVSVNLLFKKAPVESGAGQHSPFPGCPAPVAVGRLPLHRRAAGLSELAKTLEGLVGSLVGPGKVAAALQVAVLDASKRMSGSKDNVGSDDSEFTDLVDGLRDMLDGCLKGKGGQGVVDVDEFLVRYLDPKRFSGLKLISRG